MIRKQRASFFAGRSPFFGIWVLVWSLPVSASLLPGGCWARQKEGLGWNVRLSSCAFCPAHCHGMFVLECRALVILLLCKVNLYSSSGSKGQLPWWVEWSSGEATKGVHLHVDSEPVRLFFKTLLLSYLLPPDWVLLGFCQESRLLWSHSSQAPGLQPMHSIL